MTENDCSRLELNFNDVIFLDENQNVTNYEELLDNPNELFINLKVGDYVLIKGRKEPIKIKYINYKVLDKYVVDYAGVLNDNDTNLVLFNSNNVEKIINIEKGMNTF